MGNQTTKVNSVNKNNNKYADGHDNEKKSRTNWTAGRTFCFSLMSTILEVLVKVVNDDGIKFQLCK